MPKDVSKFWVQRLTEGTRSGRKPQRGARTTVHYKGTLLDGTVFDSSYKRNEPFTFTLGEGEVIKCWDEGVAQLTKGQKAVFNCPSNMAYGDRGAGNIIPPRATLRFEVELIKF